MWYVTLAILQSNVIYCNMIDGRKHALYYFHLQLAKGNYIVHVNELLLFIMLSKEVRGNVLVGRHFIIYITILHYSRPFVFAGHKFCRLHSRPTNIVADALSCLPSF